jgi:phosphohistidine phosphatase
MTVAVTASATTLTNVHGIGPAVARSSCGQAAWIGVRTLYLLRHAKSDWADLSLADRDRPLAARGRRAAQRIADHIRSEAVRPALVLCSPARRARDTLTELRPALGDQAEVLVTDDLYGADAAEILHRLGEVAQNIASVMIVGHNPGLHELALELTGDGDAAAISQLRTKFPTGALATLYVGVTRWDELAAGQAYLAALVLPRPPR